MDCICRFFSLSIGSGPSACLKQYHEERGGGGGGIGRRGGGSRGEPEKWQFPPPLTCRSTPTGSSNVHLHRSIAPAAERGGGWGGWGRGTQSLTSPTSPRPAPCRLTPPLLCPPLPHRLTDTCEGCVCMLLASGRQWEVRSV